MAARPNGGAADRRAGGELRLGVAQDLGDDRLEIGPTALKHQRMGEKGQHRIQLGVARQRRLERRDGFVVAAQALQHVAQVGIGGGDLGVGVNHVRGRA